MATTTNYGWTTPDDTALVKDGASAIRTLGSSVDTTTKNLNPETTLGDIAYRSSTANVKTRLGIGSTGNVLTVTGGVPVWAAPATPTSGLNLISTTTLTAAATTTVDSLFSNTYDTYLLAFAYKVSSNGNAAIFKYRYGSTTHSANYFFAGSGGNTSGAADNNFYASSTTGIQFPNMGSAQYGFYNATIARPQSSGRLFGNHQHNDLTYNNVASAGGFQIASDQAWSGIEITATAGTLTGTLSVYGLAK